MEKINVNSASAKQLMKIRHVGFNRAKAIIRERERRRFRDLYELSLVSGLGKARINDIINQGIART